jgi:alanine racemase
LSAGAGNSAQTADLLKWAEIDARAITANTEVLRRVVGEGVAVMAMVKAEGYGHGAALAATAALGGGATWLGVSSAEEALRLREQGFRVPILLTGWAHPARLGSLVAEGVDLTVWDPLQVQSAAAATVAEPARVHLKVDTGMGRLGCPAEALPALMEALEAAGRRVATVGLFTHFAASEAEPEFTRLQNQHLLEAATEVRARFPEVTLHAANSAAALHLPETRHSLVRCGIALYGYAPGVGADGPRSGAMSFKARVTQVKTVAAGGSVGYGRTWIAEHATRVATVAAGYADGVHRLLSNRGAVLIGGRRAPIIGRISMDQLTADISEVDGDVRAGDEAVIFGRQGNEWLGADEVAEWAGTISYEMLCAVSNRVVRVRI